MLAPCTCTVKTKITTCVNTEFLWLCTPGSGTENARRVYTGVPRYTPLRHCTSVHCRLFIRACPRVVKLEYESGVTCRVHYESCGATPPSAVS